MNRYTIILPVALAALACTLQAQENPLSTEAQQAWARTSNNIIAAAEKMPEANYDFKPAPESQSFRDLVAHTADSAMRPVPHSMERRSRPAPPR